MKKTKRVIPKADRSPARREFLEFAGLAAVGFPFARALRAGRAGELLLYYRDVLPPAQSLDDLDLKGSLGNDACHHAQRQSTGALNRLQDNLGFRV